MIALKKLYGDELLRLALVLSLLKVDPTDYLEETQQLIAGHISNGSDWSQQEARASFRPRFIHPKSLDNVLVNYERDLFEELNSLGRYGNSRTANNGRIWQSRSPVIHTYLVNNVATDSVLAGIPDGAVVDDDGVSADDNVAQEVKVEGDVEESNSENEVVLTETEEESRSDDELEAEEEDTASAAAVVTEVRQIVQPDAVVTLSADFLNNRTESDIFAEIATRSFDVNEFLVQPKEMQIKKEPDESVAEEIINVRVKKEISDDDLYSDNAIDDFVPYFATKSDKYEVGEPNTVFDQNMADLQDYNELFEEVKGQEIRNLEYLDVKQENDFERFLLENQPLDSEVYELAPMFDEELVVDVKRERASTSFTSASSSGVSDMDVASVGEAPDVKLEPDEGHHTGDELTQEDMDLIEVLWKQDVDMGFCLEDGPHQPSAPLASKVDLGVDDKSCVKPIEDVKSKEAEEDKKLPFLDQDIEDDPWAGLSYTVDTETGEYVLQGELPQGLQGEESRFDFLESALQLVELGDDAEIKDEQPQAVEGSSAAADMLHPAMRHVPHHPLAHYHNQSIMRSMSVEQRWQDLASLLTIPPPPDQYQHFHPHHHPHPQHAHNISAHGAAGGYAPNYHAPLPPPMADKHPDAYGATAPMDGAYKVESAHHPQQHDGIYYQNSTSEMPAPATQDGFLQSILNDEDLQLMDMAMNEGMYTMRMLDSASGHHPVHHNHSHMSMITERDSASDSAVSSMGSERVPSLSDGEWCDASDSAQEFHSSKFRPYDAGYGRERAHHQPPQKKHHMFGKRCFQEPVAVPLEPPRPVKFECPDTSYHHEMHMHSEFVPRQHAVPQPSLDLNLPHSSHALLQTGVQLPEARGVLSERVRHNHTYSAHLDTRPNPPRDKRVRRVTDGSMSDGGSLAGHMSRDEKRAKALGIPLEVQDIINLPMDEFNERLSKHDLSEAQLSLIRDIRRRGKNKVAAQNCRKRKLDQITSLADEVRSMRDTKLRTQRDHHALHARRAQLKDHFQALYRHVFQNLRDSEGRPISSAQYSLQQAADGNVVLVPKMQHSENPLNRTSDDDMNERKAKHYDQ